MSQNMIQNLLLTILVALSGWNMHTVNQLQLDMREVQVTHINMADIQDMKTRVDRLEWMLQADAMEK